MVDTKVHFGAGMAGIPMGLAPGRTPTLSDKPILPASRLPPAVPASAPAPAAPAPAEATLAPVGSPWNPAGPFAAPVSTTCILASPIPTNTNGTLTPAGTIDASGPTNSRLMITSSLVGSFIASPARQPSRNLPAGAPAICIDSTAQRELPAAKPNQTGRVRSILRNNTNGKKEITLTASVGACVALLRNQ